MKMKQVLVGGEKNCTDPARVREHGLWEQGNDPDVHRR